MFRYTALGAGIAIVTVSALVLSAFAQQSRTYPEYPQTATSGYQMPMAGGQYVAGQPAATVTPAAYVPYGAPTAGYGRGGYVGSPAYGYGPPAVAQPAVYAPYAGAVPAGGYTANPAYGYAAPPPTQPAAYAPYQAQAQMGRSAPANPGYGYAPATASAPYGQRTPAAGYQARTNYSPNPGYASAAAARPATGYRVAQNAPIAGYNPGPAYPTPAPAAMNNGISPVPMSSAGMVSGNCPTSGVPCEGGAPCGAGGGCGLGSYWGHGGKACGLVQHHAYYPPMHGYYYFHPYHHEHVPMQQAFASSFGLDPRNPYSNDFFKAIYAEYRASQREPAIEEVPHPLPPVTSTR